MMIVRNAYYEVIHHAKVTIEAEAWRVPVKKVALQATVVVVKGRLAEMKKQAKVV